MRHRVVDGKVVSEAFRDLEEVRKKYLAHYLPMLTLIWQELDSAKAYWEEMTAGEDSNATYLQLVSKDFEQIDPKPKV